MRFLLKYYKPYIPLILVIIVTTFGQVLLELKLPEYMARIIDEGVLTGNLRAIKTLGILMIAFAFVASACSAIGVVFTSITASGAVRKIRSDLFRKITSFNSSEFDRFSTASLITRSTNDMQQLQQATVMMLRTVIFAPIVGIGALIMAIKTSVNLSWTIGIAIIFVITVLLVTYLLALPRFRVLQGKIDRINKLLRERLTGIFVIRAFRLEEQEEKKFDEANKDLTDQFVFVNRAMAFMSPSINFIVSAAGILIVWIGTHMIEINNLQIGEMMAYIQYAAQVIFSFKYVTSIFNMIPRAAVSAERIGEVLITEPVITDSPGCVEFPCDNAKATLTFENVSYTYPEGEDESVSEISFSAEPGTITAIIGGTGSGKSTLVNLIPRLIDPTEGRVCINGVDIRDIAVTDLRKHVGLVPQKIRLLGKNLSGGQKQKLAIKQMTERDAEIMIFDDSFSALDFESEKEQRKFIRKKLSDKTIVIVSQRISTVMQADRIIVLENGRVAGLGRHEELMHNCEIYREIAETQLNEEMIKAGGCF